MPPIGTKISGYEPAYLYDSMTLARIYRHTESHSCLSFNPNIPAKPEDGGRFDRTCPEDSPTMYAAVVPKKPKRGGAYTAIIETLRPLFQDVSSGWRPTLMLSELENRSIQFFSVRHQLTLASITAPAHIGLLNGPEDLLCLGDRSVTQAWGHYWQSGLPKRICGLMYHSTPSTMNNGHGSSFVLWGDRIRDRNVFRPISARSRLQARFGVE